MAMKWNRFSISAAMLMCAMHMSAADSTYVDAVDSTYVVDSTKVIDNTKVQEVQESKYEQHLERRAKVWASLIPTHFVIQNAGNMGVISLGVGWSYGKNRKWETDLLFGYIPRHDSSRGKLTTTLKGNYIPWRIDLNPSNPASGTHWKIEPFTVSLYLNTVYGHEFWKSQPGRYPDKYYEFLSTKFRLNVAFGQRITLKIPENKRKLHNRISLFYEVGTCDLYIRSLFQGQDVSFGDILGLSIGLKFFLK